MRYSLAIAAAVVVAAPAYAAPATFHGALRGGVDLSDGVGVGGTLGVDVGLGGKAFVGISAGLDDSPEKDCVSNFFVVGDKVCLSAGRDISAEARLGFRAGGGKIYALGGYSNLALKPSVSYAGSSVSGSSIKVDGFKIGAGIEYPIAGKVFTRVEYRYGNYEQGVTTHSIMPSIGISF